MIFEPGIVPLNWRVTDKTLLITGFEAFLRG
jgi:hypothetical protein